MGINQLSEEKFNSGTFHARNVCQIAYIHYKWKSCYITFWKLLQKADAGVMKI